MVYLEKPDQAIVLSELRKGQTLTFYKPIPNHGLVEVQMYVIDDAEIVVSPNAEENASELESQYYAFDQWDTIWHYWELEAIFQVDAYTLM